MSDYHESVLKKEATDLLQVKKGAKYIDATLGGGGHTKEILDHGGIVLGIDQDSDAIKYVEDSLEFRIQNSELTLVHGNFNNLKHFAKENSFEGVSGILFDLGVSTHQLETPERGFSFNKDAKLDMRMNQETQVTALDLVNGLTQNELADLFWKFGEDRFARKIAGKITEARKIKPIETADELAKIILSVRFKSFLDRTHPATRVFQALRIVVNDELNDLKKALPDAVSILNSGGRIVAISFHSLEDRIVKEEFIEFSKNGWGEIVSKKPVTPTREEIQSNPRSRSAKLRVFQKI